MLALINFYFLKVKQDVLNISIVKTEYGARFPFFIVSLSLYLLKETKRDTITAAVIDLLNFSSYFL